jgi:hypothetical protein
MTNDVIPRMLERLTAGDPIMRELVGKHLAEAIAKAEAAGADSVPLNRALYAAWLWFSAQPTKVRH